MIRLKFGHVAFCLFAIACLSDAASLPQLCGQQKVVGSFVSGGDSSQRGQFPWAGVMLQKDTMQPFCGCSLISNEFAITAAHCFYENDTGAITRMSSVLVQFGRNDLNDGEENSVTRSVVDLTLHDDWDPFHEGYDADIAIIRLNQTVSFSKYIQPICLPMPGKTSLGNGTIVSNLVNVFMSCPLIDCCRSVGALMMELETPLRSNSLLKLMLLIMAFVMKDCRIEHIAVGSQATESILVEVMAASTLKLFIYYATN